MANKWTVSIITHPKQNVYPGDYFPRSFHYKQSAIDLAKKVEKQGGKAVVEPTKK